MSTHLTPSGTGNVEADFIMDYTDDEPRRLVRFTMDKTAVAVVRQLIYAAGDQGQFPQAQPEQVRNAFSIAAFLGRVETELESRSLDSIEDFKATKPDPGSVL